MNPPLHPSERRRGLSRLAPRGRCGPGREERRGLRARRQARSLQLSAYPLRQCSAVEPPMRPVTAITLYETI
jgi:hypothetical protein